MEDRYIRACLRCHAPLAGLTCPTGHEVLTAAGDRVWAVVEVASGRTVAPLVTESAEQSVRWEQWFLDRYAPQGTNRPGHRQVPIRDPSRTPKAMASRRRRLRCATVEHLVAAVNEAATRLAHGLPLSGSAA